MNPYQSPTAASDPPPAGKTRPMRLLAVLIGLLGTMPTVMAVATFLDAPTVAAYAIPHETGVAWGVWCRYCEVWHAHGIGDGHREAHCSGETPYVRTGYNLAFAGDVGVVVAWAAPAAAIAFPSRRALRWGSSFASRSWGPVMTSKSLPWIVAVVVALAAGWQLASAQKYEAKTVQKWEYKWIHGGEDSIPHGNVTKELAKLGDEGWELVAVEPATTYVQGSNARNSMRVFHLKRPK